MMYNFITGEIISKYFRKSEVLNEKLEILVKNGEHRLFTISFYNYQTYISFQNSPL